jgi:Asp-tRNA(Asn)/Glu-tRNA(Gln) amidotransferase A subunit family amidase
LKGARIGVMLDMMGTAERHRAVNQVVESVVRRFEALGAVVIRFELPQYDALAESVRTVQFEAREAMDDYFSTLGSDASVRSIADVIGSNTSVVQQAMDSQLAVVDRLNSGDYKTRMLNRDRLRLLVATKMADLDLDAILYPLQKVLVVPIGADDQSERNGTLSNGTGFPAVTFPGGFSSPTESAPLGVPVGVDLLGRDYSEARLLAYAYAYEQSARPRKPPLSTPPLPGEP